jgi:hypothetical protein
MVATLLVSEKPLNPPDESFDESSSESALKEDVHPNPSVHSTNSKSDSKRDASPHKSRRAATPPTTLSDLEIMAFLWEHKMTHPRLIANSRKLQQVVTNRPRYGCYSQFRIAIQLDRHQKNSGAV